MGFEPPTLWFSSVREVFFILPYMCLISVFPCWSVFFPIYGRKYSMKVKLFMENMWEFFYVFYLFHTKLIFPCMQGDLIKSTVRNIFVGYKWKITFQTKPLWGFATVCTVLVVFFRRWRKLCTILQPLGSQVRYLKKCPKSGWPIRIKETWTYYMPLTLLSQRKFFTIII